MKISARCQVLSRVVKAVLIIGAACQIVALPVLAQEAKKEKKVKDQGEYDIFTAANKETDPTKQLAILQTWKEKYPDSDFKQERADTVAMAYDKMNKGPETIKAIQDALAMNPKDLTCLQLLAKIAGGVLRNANPPADVLALGDQSSSMLISNLDNFFDASVKPATVADAAWTKAKTDTGQLAETVQGYVKWKSKDNAAAEAAFRKVLTANGENSQVAMWLASVLYSQKKYSEGLFEYARAAAYTGTGALDAKTRQSYADFLKKAYEGYHGKDDAALEQLKQQASTAALPPDGFHIDSVIDIQKKEEGDTAKFNADHPDIAFFRTLRDALKGDTGQSYFDSGVKDALIPPQEGAFKQFKGHVVSQPSPKELVLAIDDANGDVTLVFDPALKAKIDPGQEISFAGAPEAFTKEPFNLKFKVDRENVTGLPKEAGAPARRAVPKKTVPKK
jgi:tetratricopeptide (TPR) repeat protein